MKRLEFHTADYIVMAIFVAISSAIGIYYGFYKMQRTTEEYILGNRQIHFVPVALSLAVTFQSAVSIIGSPSEIYLYNTMVAYTFLGLSIAYLIQAFFIVPLVHPLRLTSAYEYLQRRFQSRAVQLLGMTMGMLQTEIPVLGAADLLAATISRRRTFQFFHGGIVPTHDKLGQRVGRELNPMLRIIEYLRLLGLRPLELMKSFDKTSSFELPREEFIDQIKRIGVKLHPYEIDALANSISGKGYNKNVINYRKLSLAVREVVMAERERKIREREEWLQIKTYHESILKKGTLDEYISHSGSTRLIDPKDSLKMKSFQTIAPSGTSRNSTGSKPGSPDSNKVLQLSLCSPLALSKSVLEPDKQKSKRRNRRKEIHNI